jgi:pilus assembly protein CpaE
VKLTLQTLNLLHYPKDRISLVLNRVGGKTDLKKSEVEKALDLRVAFELPVDRDVAAAANRGVPVPLSASRSGVARGLGEMAKAFADRRADAEKAGHARRPHMKLRKAA